MSRVMKRTGVVHTVMGAIGTVLQCPPGHKYEVLGGLAHKAPTAGDTNGWLLVTSSGDVLWIHMEVNSPVWTNEFKPGELVLYPGDKLSVYNSGAGIAAVVTYVDVDT